VQVASSAAWPNCRAGRDVFELRLAEPNRQPDFDSLRPGGGLIAPFGTGDLWEVRRAVDLNGDGVDEWIVSFGNDTDWGLERAILGRCSKRTFTRIWGPKRAGSLLTLSEARTEFAKDALALRATELLAPPTWSRYQPLIERHQEVLRGGDDPNACEDLLFVRSDASDGHYATSFEVRCSCREQSCSKVGSTVSEAESPRPTAQPAALPLVVAPVLSDVDAMWALGATVVAATSSVNEASLWQRSLVSFSSATPRAATTHPKLVARLKLDQYRSVDGIYGNWPTQVWMAVRTDLITSTRVELYRADAARASARLVFAHTGSMRARLDAVERGTGQQLFLAHDAFVTSFGPRFVAASKPPLPRFPVVTPENTDCLIPFEVCGLTPTEQGFSVAGLRCGRAFSLLEWRGASSSPQEALGPRGGAELRCQDHPASVAQAASAEIKVEQGRVYVRLGDSFRPVAVRTIAGKALARVQSVMRSESGELWMLDGNTLYAGSLSPETGQEDLTTPRPANQTD
jgi:hypothetical protein